VGKPARIIGKTSEYKEYHEKQLQNIPVFKEVWTLDTGINNEKKKEMKNSLKNRRGYIYLNRFFESIKCSCRCIDRNSILLTTYALLWRNPM
jgi:hypothetical protein